MKNEILTFEQLQEYRENESKVFASSKANEGGIKELRLTFLGCIEVWHRGKVKRRFIFPTSAVEFYNEL